MLKDYSKYQKCYEKNSKCSFPLSLKGFVTDFLILTNFIMFLDYIWKNKLRLVRIYFDTPTFDIITKDRSAKFVDMLSAIGGTMGLLTGFSIISGVEIMYFAVKILLSFISKGKRKQIFKKYCRKSHQLYFH